MYFILAALALVFSTYFATAIGTDGINEVLAGIPLAALAAYTALTRPIAGKNPAIWWIIAALPALLMVSPLFSTYPFGAFLRVPSMLALPLTVLVTLAWCGTEETNRRRCFDAIAIFMVGIAAVLVAQVPMLPNVIGAHASWPTQHGHVAAAILAMIFPYILWRAYTSAARGQWLWLLATLVVEGGILAAGVQAPFYISVIAFALVSAPYIKAQTRFMVAGLAGGIAVYVALNFAMHNFAEVQSGTAMVGQSLGERRDIWASAIDAIKQSPWRGYGLGQYEHAAEPFRRELDRNAGLSAHNDILQLWVDLGIGAVLWIVGLAVLVGMAVWNNRARLLSTPLLALVLGAGSAFGVMLTNNIAYDPSAMMVLGSLLAGVLLYITQDSAALPVAHAARQVFAAALVVLGIGALGISGGQWYYHKAFAAGIAANSVRQAGEALDAAEAISFSQNSGVFELRAALANSLLATSTPKEEGRENLIQISTRNASVAHALNPLAPEPMYLDAERARLLGDAKQQESILRNILNKSPNYLSARLSLYLLLKQQHRNDEAYTLLRAARFWQSYNQSYAPLYQTLLTEAWQRGDQDTVKDALMMMGSIPYAKAIAKR